MLLNYLTISPGVSMEVHGKEMPCQVFADIICKSCDSPARCKLSGGASHSHKNRLCAWCTSSLAQFQSVDLYANEDTVTSLTNDNTWLKTAWKWLTATADGASNLFSRYGIRW